jgi:phage terminase large subunit-like protein
VEEFRTFPLGKHDDQVDAAARAFNSLARKVEVYFA